jgi:hypothetical protein
MISLTSLALASGDGPDADDGDERRRKDVMMKPVRGDE